MNYKFKNNVTSLVLFHVLEALFLNKDLWKNYLRWWEVREMAKAWKKQRLEPSWKLIINTATLLFAISRPLETIPAHGIYFRPSRYRGGSFSPPPPPLFQM